MNKFFKGLAAVVGGPAGVVGAVVGELITDWKTGRENKRQVQKATAEYKVKQALSETTYKRDWELAALNGSGLWMRRGTLILFSVPLVWGYFDPDIVLQYFKTLDEMPEWYLASYGAMLGAVWGSMELRQWRAGKDAS